MTGDELAGVFLRRLVGGFVFAPIQEEVVTHTTADEAALDTREGIDSAVDVEQLGMTGVEVRADLRMDAAGTSALLTGILVAPVHAVHVGRGSAEVGEVAFEVGHLDDLLHLFQDALLRAAGDELALMGGDGAEGTAAKTAAMDVDGVLDHVVGGDALALVFRMGLARVRQVERGVDLLRGHRRVGRVNDDISAVDTLQQPLGVHHVGLLLDMAEVLGLGPFVAQTLLVAVEHDIVFADATRNGVSLSEVDGLRNVAYLADGCSFGQSASEFDVWFLAHAVDEQVGTRIDEDALAELFLPVVEVGESAQGGLDASEHDGHIGEELLQDAGIDDRGVLRSQVVTPIGAVGVLRAQTPIGGVLVDHRVHTAWRDAKEESGSPQLLEVAEVAVPIRLRHDGHAIACCLECAPDDSCSEGRVVDISISGEQNDVELIPSSEFELLLRRRQKIRQFKTLNIEL